MIIYQSVFLITICFATINSHGYHHHERNRHGHERTWFQMSLPFLDASIQFPQPPGFDPDRLFDLMTSPFQQWNPMEPPPFMRPFFERPNRFRPMMPPIPPALPPYSPPSSQPPPPPLSEPVSTTKTLPDIPPPPPPPSPTTVSNPNSIPDSEPESTFSVSSSTFNPSRRRYKPRWVPHHSRRRFGSKRPSSGGRRGNGNGYGGNRHGGSDGGCKYVPGTKGGRKCPGQRFWEHAKPSLIPQPSGWPFFIFPPPRPSTSNDDDKPQVPNTFTEVTKNIDPACGNRHLPRPTKPSTNDSDTTITTLSPADNGKSNNNNGTNESTSSSSPSPSTTTELPTTSVSSVDIEPSSDTEKSKLSPSSPIPVQPSEKPLTPPEVLKSSNEEPENDKNPSESDSRNGSEPESGKKEEKKEKKPELESSVFYLAKESEDKISERTDINNGEDISSSGLMTTMGPLEPSPSKPEETIDNGNGKKEIESKENEDEDDKTVDRRYSSSSASPENIVTSMAPNDVNNGDNSGRDDVTTMGSDLGNINNSMNEADTIPDEKGINKDDDEDDDDVEKSTSPELDVKRKRETERQQFIKQIESMSIEDFRRLATKIASISI